MHHIPPASLSILQCLNNLNTSPWQLARGSMEFICTSPPPGQVTLYGRGVHSYVWANNFSLCYYYTICKSSKEIKLPPPKLKCLHLSLKSISFRLQCIVFTMIIVTAIIIKPLILVAPNPKISMFLILSCSCLCPIHWSQVLSRERKYSWSSDDRRCSNYIWMINNFITQGAHYIRDLTICLFLFLFLPIYEPSKL